MDNKCQIRVFVIKKQSMNQNMYRYYHFSECLSQTYIKTCMYIICKGHVLFTLPSNFIVLHLRIRNILDRLNCFRVKLQVLDCLE